MIVNIASEKLITNETLSKKMEQGIVLLGK